MLCHILVWALHISLVWPYLISVHLLLFSLIMLKRNFFWDVISDCIHFTNKNSKLQPICHTALVRILLKYFLKNAGEIDKEKFGLIIMINLCLLIRTLSAMEYFLLISLNTINKMIFPCLCSSVYGYPSVFLWKQWIWLC